MPLICVWMQQQFGYFLKPILILFYLVIGDRIIFKKERSNGCYQTSSYYCASMFSDLLPLRMVFPLIYAIVVYWMAGFVGDAEHFLKFLLVFLLFNIVSGAMFYVISVSVPSVTGTKFYQIY